ncbi:MAG TPA: hypothetical protein VLQ79_01905 [Myxococcaceae bacterium]|nr:hypothetical protein [Myxococcaceae bacterium]
MTSSPRAALAALLLALAALPGCLTSGELQCAAGLSKCANTCVAIQTDTNNCGSCGSACNGGNVCVAGGCVCPTGQQVCNGVCTALGTDPRNCGSCGYVCGTGQACNQGVCEDCGSGGCRTALVAGCIATPGGYLQRIHDLPGGLLLDAPANPAGASFPDALGVLGSVLLYADHDSSSLFEIPIASLGNASAAHPSLVGPTTGSKAGTTQLSVATSDGGTLLYATTSNVNAIRIFNGPPVVDAGTLLANGSGSLGLVAAGGAAFDAGSFPEPFAAIGNEIFVPLNGTGQVLRVNVANPASAQLVATYDLQPLVAALPGGGVAPDGGPFIASPTQAIARNGYVYVAANVLRYYADFSGADYGPPLVAKIDPGASDGGAVTAVTALAGTGSLDAGIPCQNVEWLANLPLGAVATPMLVSCAGARTYDADFNVTSVTNTALVLLDPRDQPVGFWIPSARPDGRFPPSVGRAVPQNTSVYVADETAGRLYVVDYTSNGFVERVGFRNGLSPPTICPSYITDLTVVPAP